jgi:hypothetical protein
MSLAVMVFVLFAVLLIGLLLWALRPAKRWSNPAQDVFKLLSQPRHCMHIPHILHALQPEDTEFLKEDGQTELMHAVRRQRRRIALEYLNQLQEEFEMLLEVSRALAVMAPEVVTMQEMERWKLSLGFALNCTLLRLRLRCGLQPLEGFHLLSGMAIDMLRNLDAATSRIAEVAVRGVGLPGGGAKESSDH